MTTLSIVLSDTLAKASQETAKALGLSRTEFIRQAIVHELRHIRVEQEQRAIAESLRAMQNSADYQRESDEISQGFSIQMPNEENGWWKK